MMNKCGQFNQDGSCIAISQVPEGFTVYRSNPLEVVYRSELPSERLRLVQMVKRSNIFLLLKECGDTVCLWDASTNTAFAQIPYNAPISKVLVHDNHFAVVTDSTVHVHNVIRPELKFKQRVDALNCVAMSAVNFATVNPESPQNVCVYDIQSGNKIHDIKSHNNPVRCVALSADGTVMATTSINGTVVHLYVLTDVPVKQHKEVRRSTTASRTYCMAISADKSKVASVGDFGVAVWSTQEPSTNTQSALSFMGSVVSYFNSEYPCATFTALPGVGEGTTCVFEDSVLHVSTPDGVLRTFALIDKILQKVAEIQIA
eukprot:PhF_6_TR43598/c0_g1_i1/m.66961